MRPLCLIVILFAVFTQVKSYATEQIRNRIIHNGKVYILEDDILYPYLVKANKWEWKEDEWCSALWRQYYITLEIVNNELILKYIGNCQKSLLKDFLSAFNLKDSTFKLDWFTGSIVIGEGKPLYAGIHEHYSKLHFEKGMLIKETHVGYKEYLIISYLEGWLRIKENIRELPDMDHYGRIEMFNEGYQKYWEIIEHYLETKKEDESEFLAKLKMEYEKRFGEPISDFELKIQRMKFWGEYNFEITRTLYGARILYYDVPKEWIEAKLNIEDWLDFIRALFTCCLDKWEKKFKVGSYYPSRQGEFYVLSSSKDKPYDGRYEFPIKNAKQPYFKEFEKTMENMIAKIRKSSSLPPPK